jgi:hypothetical protein
MKVTVRVAILSMLASLATCAGATAVAQAHEGPFYEIGEERLEEGNTAAVTLAAKTSLKLEAKTGQVITCTGASFAGATLDGSSGENAGTSKETIEYTGCSVTGNGSGCKVESEKITTNALKTTLGYSSEARATPVLELVEPSSGKVITEPKFAGEKCTTKSTKVSGSVIGELPSTEFEGSEEELQTTKAERTTWTESGGKLTSTKGALEAFGTSATEEAEDEIQTKVPASVLVGNMTSMCETPLTEHLAKCNEGGYFPEEEEFTATNLGDFEIIGGTTLKCTESTAKFDIGKNPSTRTLATEVTEMTFGGCKVGTTNCTLTAGAGGGRPAPPWAGSITWTKIGTEGTNGFQTFGKISIKGECGMEECTYVGAGINTSMPAGVFNANDTNKPVIEPEGRAELQFKKSKMTAGGRCSGQAEISAVYNIVPKDAVKNVYLTNQ